jgi:hypothetical protein
LGGRGFFSWVDGGGEEDSSGQVKTGGVVRVRYMLFNTDLCNHIILLESGGGT